MVLIVKFPPIYIRLWIFCFLQCMSNIALRNSQLYKIIKMQQDSHHYSCQWSDLELPVAWQQFHLMHLCKGLQIRPYIKPWDPFPSNTIFCSKRHLKKICLCSVPLILSSLWLHVVPICIRYKSGNYENFRNDIKSLLLYIKKYLIFQGTHLIQHIVDNFSTCVRQT